LARKFIKKQNMNKEFILTEDGSHTIYIPEMDEHYHSVHGAIQESLHIYINQGLLFSGKKTLSVLEIGFGTGLNAWLTYCYAFQKKLSVNYLSLEKYPLSESEYILLNYPSIIFPEYAKAFLDIHGARWNTDVEISPEFTLHKCEADLQNFRFDEGKKFDLVYYDAFAPGKQPEMWTDEIIAKVAGCVEIGGILVTYCAKGSVRRSFTTTGFTMERIEGPIGKKEILRGKKTI
jgi:tRNA U34 5-methylaminomethyl-2-thiouridine-forming methyltransferase MnmC